MHFVPRRPSPWRPGPLNAWGPAICGRSTGYAASGASIYGHYVPPGVSAVGGRYGRPPNFCFECGKQFPWTAEKLSAAHELADELENLNQDERAKLKTALDDISFSGPRAETSMARRTPKRPATKPGGSFSPNHRTKTKRRDVCRSCGARERSYADLAFQSGRRGLG